MTIINQTKNNMKRKGDIIGTNDRNFLQNRTTQNRPFNVWRHNSLFGFQYKP